ncbi:MAG: hypothetical protein ACSHX3_15815 [Litorimonas sp.]
MSNEPLMGRARVRALFIDPLEAGGMVRPARVTVDDHKAFLTKVADECAYMSDLGLKGLGKYLIRLAGEKQVWPRINTIRSQAWAMEPAPAKHNEYAMSVLMSRLGEEALRDGWHAELLLDMRKMKPVPQGDFVKGQLAQRAKDNQRNMKVVDDRAARGVARDGDAGWRAAYTRGQDEARQIIQSGIDKRAAK